MFYGIENIKIKNLFVLCDAISTFSGCTRNSLVRFAHLSYPTVSKAAELLLDMGIITERQSGKNYFYRFDPKYYFAIADLRGTFRMSFTDLGGHELYQVTHKENDAFFFDEKLSLFFRDTSLLAGRRFPKSKLCGVCVILPSIGDTYRDTRGILGSKERMCKLIASYFDCSIIRVTTAADAASEMCVEKRALIIMKEPMGVVCKAVGYGCDKVTLLKSVGTTSIGRCTGADELAHEIACAVGNICDLLSPEVIYVDGDRLFSASSFPQRFKAALACFNCVEESELVPIIHSGGSLAVSGGARMLRCEYIKSIINASNKRSTT